MTFWKWSQTAGSNGNADATINFAEGQAASTLNDSCRGVMAALAKYRDDAAGAIITGGTVNFYSVSTYEVFDTLAHLHNQAIAFTPHVTNTGPTVLTVDGLSTKVLRPAPGVDFIGGELIQGTPYMATYNNTDSAFYVRGFMSSPYAVPIFGGMDFWDTVAPNSCFIFPQGQAISRTTYAKAFARWGVAYGAGDGSLTFNVPDVTGRVRAMIESAPARLTSSYFGGNSTVLGATGGGENHTLTTAEIPVHSHANSLTDPGHSHSVPFTDAGQPVTTGSGSGGRGGSINPGVTGNASTGITITNANAGGGNPHAIVQPTIVCNYIIRVL